MLPLYLFIVKVSADIEAGGGPAAGLPNNVEAVCRTLEAAGIIFVARNGDCPGVGPKRDRPEVS